MTSISVPRSNEHYLEPIVWEKTDYFCPACGKQEVWREDGEGDYYVREDYVCISCGVEFNLPTGAEPASSLRATQAISFIRQQTQTK